MQKEYLGIGKGVPLTLLTFACSNTELTPGEPLEAPSSEAPSLGTADTQTLSTSHGSLTKQIQGTVGILRHRI